MKICWLIFLYNQHYVRRMEWFLPFGMIGFDWHIHLSNVLQSIWTLYRYQYLYFCLGDNMVLSHSLKIDQKTLGRFIQQTQSKKLNSIYMFSSKHTWLLNHSNHQLNTYSSLPIPLLSVYYHFFHLFLDHFSTWALKF